MIRRAGNEVITALAEELKNPYIPKKDLLILKFSPLSYFKYVHSALSGAINYRLYYKL